MIRTLLLLGLIAAPALGTEFAPNLLVRYTSTNDSFGSEYFIELPWNITSATSKGWVNVSQPERPAGYADLDLYCDCDDYTLCLLFDKEGNIAGLQIALLKQKFTPYYNLEDQRFITNWTTTINGTTAEYYTMTQYYISPDPATRKARDPTMIPQGGVWYPDPKGQLFQVSSNTSDLTNNKTIFTKQACVDRMGDHYFCNMTKTLECSAETMNPWVQLVYSNQYVGYGAMFMGTLSLASGEKNWFENTTSSGVEEIVPNGPQCMYDLADTPGMVTLHIYFVDKPWSVLTCS